MPSVPHADTPLLTVDTPPANPRALLPCRGDEALSGAPLYKIDIPERKRGYPAADQAALGDDLRERDE